MKRKTPPYRLLPAITLLFLMTILGASPCFAQASGNIGYSEAGGNRRAEQNEIAKRSPTNVPPSATSMFVEASVLMNVKADEYVAVFGIAEECLTVPECNQKMDATVAEFTTALRQLGVKADDLYVDFAAQNKIYGYQIEGNIAKEKLMGFELKKNISIHYKDKELLDKLVVTASRSRIFDLIKVDYIVSDPSPIQNRLMEEAARIVKQKVSRYERLMGIKLLPPAQIYAEKPSIYFPTELYDSYTAAESENISPDYYSDRQRYTIQRARKSRTFFFNPVKANQFDYVINPVVIEPVVQFTLYLKIKYEVEGLKEIEAAKAASGVKKE
ncbi:MAG TPA: SIMPL domain-containing protein [Pyrinomonadaceae bacterium]|nr:SIMPL domain-containing protein [Pyrinomonadaceae bacterium]